MPLWAWLVWVGRATVHSSPAAPALLPIYLASVLVVAGVSFRWIERPARAAIRARWTGWEARHAPTSRQLDRAPAASATLAP